MTECLQLHVENCWFVSSKWSNEEFSRYVDLGHELGRCWRWSPVGGWVSEKAKGHWVTRSPVSRLFCFRFWVSSRSMIATHSRVDLFEQVKIRWRSQVTRSEHASDKRLSLFIRLLSLSHLLFLSRFLSARLSFHRLSYFYSRCVSIFIYFCWYLHIVVSLFGGKEENAREVRFLVRVPAFLFCLREKLLIS